VFRSGRQERFDLVVGADGQHSATRRALAVAPRPLQTTAVPVGLAIATVPLPLEIDDPAVVRMHNEPGVSMTVHPAGGHPGVAFIFRTDEVPATHAARLDLLRTKYASVGWRAAEFLDALDGVPESSVYFDGVQKVAADRWVRGPIVLLGDAASSLTILGNGSSTALAGAAVLDRALAESPDIPTALDRYERAHRPVAERAQRGAAVGASFLVPRSRVGLGIRDLLARLMRTV
jgi:2-polyprenyl-6-methoxyphenol hydroxylase-like FAD-dependent oxidoreductase